MEKKTFLIPFLVIFTVITLMFASAELAVDGSNGITTSFNDVVLDGSTIISGLTGEIVPVRVAFTALNDDEDVRIKVRMEGFREDVSSSTGRFNIINGSTYSKLVSLRLPFDIKDLTKDYTLYVEISSADDRTERVYNVRMQRESYTFEILSIDYNTNVKAGEIVPVAVVVKNIGMQRLEDGYVVVSIPELGISTRGFFGVTEPVIDCSECDFETSVQKVVYLKIPEDAKVGIYELEVKAYNRETVTSSKKLVSVSSDKLVTIIAGVKTQNINAGETKTYELIVVNSADNVKIFNVQSVSNDALEVSTPSVITVGPRSSTTVPITVHAVSDANAGTYTFSVDVDDEQVVFGANVVEGSTVSTSIVALTVVLAIIFVVLLVILIVLLTRRESSSKIEEVETSYY